MKVTCKPECGNAPKMELIRQLCIALADVDIAKISDIVTENVTWNVIGERVVESKDNFINALVEMSDIRVMELELSSILTHGRVGAAHGSFKLENDQVFAFSEFYVFASAKGNKVRDITTFIIETH